MSQMFVLHPLFALLLLLFAICHAAPMLESRAGTQVATFAGGCFWGVEDLFTKQFTKGLSKTTTGYIGGSAPNPKYRDVCSGATGHAEAVRFEFNPSVVKYDDLVEFFYRSHDPTVANRQGSDVGSQYRSVIFYTTPQQQAIAQKVTQDVQKRSSSQAGRSSRRFFRQAPGATRRPITRSTCRRIRKAISAPPTVCTGDGIQRAQHRQILMQYIPLPSRVRSDLLIKSHLALRRGLSGARLRGSVTRHHE